MDFGKEITVDSVTLIVGLLVQFGGIVWHASKLKSQIIELSTNIEKVEKNTKEKLDRLEIETRADRESVLKIVYQFPIIMEGIQNQMTRFENTIIELKEELKAERSK